MSKRKTRTPEETHLARATDYRAVFSTPAGKRVLLDMMNRHSMLAPMYTGDQTEFFIREGERKVVLHILRILNIDVAELRERISQDVSED